MKYKSFLHAENLRLKISPDGHWFRMKDDRPFFWLGDTGWLMLIKLNLAEIKKYLTTRAEQGFNVIQVMLVHRFPQKDCDGAAAIPDGDFSNLLRNKVLPYWEKVDKSLEIAASLGIILALVPMWGSNVKEHKMSVEQAAIYGKFLGQRYRNVPNIVWINGGDIRGEEQPEVWHALGEAIKSDDPDHLMTFHPFGRTDSSWWFHNASWLDFNMFQSGHRRYGQLNAEGDYRLKDGLEEDNWRYVLQDRERFPVKPVLDGEPSYEDIPQGLLDLTQPPWKASDVRRYAWWSVLAGAAGHTYGHNAVMQMHGGNGVGAYGCKTHWFDALKAPGACQMKHLRRLMRYFMDEDRRPEPIEPHREKYDHIAALSGRDFLLAYSWRSGSIPLPLDELVLWPEPVAAWYDPETGIIIDVCKNLSRTMHSPKPYGDGCDIVLIITTRERLEEIKDL